MPLHPDIEHLKTREEEEGQEVPLWQENLILTFLSIIAVAEVTALIEWIS